MENELTVTYLERLAGDQAITLEQAKKLAENSYFGIREALAENSALAGFGEEGERLLERLLTEDKDRSSVFVNAGAARNPALPQSLFAIAAKSKRKEVRIAFASNQTSSPAFLPFLLELLNDQEEEVRLAAARNPRINELSKEQEKEMLLAIGKEESMRVLGELAKQEGLPSSIYNGIAKKALSKGLPLPHSQEEEVISNLMSNKSAKGAINIKLPKPSIWQKLKEL